MQFQQLLPKRRMVRHYAPEPVSRDAVERIVATVRRAPSAGYSQGQRLLVVTEDEARAEVVRIATSGWGAADEGLEPWMESAPVHVFVCTREADYHERYNQEDKLVDGEEIEWPVPFWHVDAGAALMLILLAALDEGLAAGLTGVPHETADELRAAFGIPEDVTVVAHVTIGVPAPDPGWSAATSRATKPRRDDNVHWERWS
jgi:FMN reductase [NAD(P)H]